MASDPTYERLRELSWRRTLTAAEEAELRAWLKGHPEVEADWEAEAALNETLRRLADVPVATNFTARVLQAVEREAADTSRSPILSWRAWHWRLRWLPRAALAAIVLGAGLFSLHELQAARRKEMAQSVAVVSTVTSLPGPEILTNYEAICVMSQPPPADEELLALMK
jgi:anti-sigma factor RsiW